jgi:Uncharacterised nucleotidyltransferase
VPAVDVDFERLVLDGLGRLLMDEQDLGVAAYALNAASQRLPEIPAVLAKHKVVPIAATNLARLKERQLAGPFAGELLLLLEEPLNAALRHRRLLLDELQRLTAQSAVLRDAILLKGFSNGRFYPVPYTRWMRDIDLFCRDWPTAQLLADQLLADGYAFDTAESPWVKADRRHGRDIYGQIFLIKAIGDDFSRIDVHFGTYSAGYSGYLKPALHDAAVPHDVGGSVLLALEPAECLLVAAAHTLSDGYVSAKDTNDLVAMACARPEVDWRSAAEVIASHSLAPQVKLLVDHALSLYGAPLVRQACQLLLAGLEAAPTRVPWQTHNRDWGLRARVNSEFAYRWERSLGKSAVSAARTAAQCYLFYIRRLRLEVRPRSPRERLLRALMPAPDLARWNLRPDACVLLIDADVVRALDVQDTSNGDAGAPPRRLNAPAEGIAVLERGGHLYLQVVGRTYVPTLDLLIPPPHARFAPR